MASQLKAVATKEHLLRPRQEGLPKKIMSQHRFEVATRKEDIVGHNREIMSPPESKAKWTCYVSARIFQVATKIEVETPIKVATWNSCRDNKNELYS